MGFFDDVQASISRGTEAVGRGTKSAQLKLRLNELVKERQKLTAQLGAGLYDKLKDDAVMREGLDPLFDGIAAIDAQRNDIQNQIDALEAQGAARAAAAVTYKCPDCGALVGATDVFCSGCGKPIDDIKAAAEVQAAAREEGAATAASMPLSASGEAFEVDGNTCPHCGAALAEGDMFCMSCGRKIDDSDN